MNKTELIKIISNKNNLNRKKSQKLLESILDIITESLKIGNSVKLIGFGTFKISFRKSRIGRNPKNGKELVIKSSKIPTFSSSKILKKKINLSKI